MSEAESFERENMLRRNGGREGGREGRKEGRKEGGRTYPNVTQSILR